MRSIIFFIFAFLVIIANLTEWSAFEETNYAILIMLTLGFMNLISAVEDKNKK